MQYGSIGWAVGALLGYASALKGQKRVIAGIGDGSFQVTAQVLLLPSLGNCVQQCYNVHCTVDVHMCAVSCLPCLLILAHFSCHVLLGTLSSASAELLGF
jgi:Thiamine pyrophosphate enzyme, C-terminal TPP binding domain